MDVINRLLAAAAAVGCLVALPKWNWGREGEEGGGEEGGHERGRTILWGIIYHGNAIG